jgi:hypothetical protein
MLTPKFGTGGSLICGPDLVKNLVQRRKVSSKRFGRDARGRQFCFRSARELFALISWDRMVTWPERKDEWMDKHSHLGVNLGIKYCARSPPGVMPRQGINMNPGCL